VRAKASAYSGMAQGVGDTQLIVKRTQGSSGQQELVKAAAADRWATAIVVANGQKKMALLVVDQTALSQGKNSAKIKAMENQGMLWRDCKLETQEEAHAQSLTRERAAAHQRMEQDKQRTLQLCIDWIATNYQAD
jgi:hypothetical protein